MPFALPIARPAAPKALLSSKTRAASLQGRDPSTTSVSQKVIRGTHVITLHGVARKRMMFSLSAGPQEAYRNQQNPIGETLSLSVLRQGNPLVRSQSQKASSRLTIEVKPKASSAVKNEDKAASLEPRKAFTPKRH